MYVDPFNFTGLVLLLCSLILSLIFFSQLVHLCSPYRAKRAGPFLFSKTTAATGEHDGDDVNAGNAAGGGNVTYLTPSNDAGCLRQHRNR